MKNEAEKMDDHGYTMKNRALASSPTGMIGPPSIYHDAQPHLLPDTTISTTPERK